MIIEAAKGENPGLAFLANRAKGVSEVKTGCVKVRTLLDGREFYIPGGVGDIQPIPTPPFAIHVPVAYSEMNAKMDEKFIVTGVNRHRNFTIMGTGITVEEVDHPEWWSKRDTNGI